MSDMDSYGLDVGCAYWILFNWLPSIVSNYRYLCEQSSTQADPNRRCIYLPLATGRAAEGCVEPADRTGLLNFVGMGDLGEPMDGADHTPCPWTAGLPLDGSAAYLTNTAAMFVVRAAHSHNYRLPVVLCEHLTLDSLLFRDSVVVS